MSQLPNPFSMRLPHTKLTKGELIQAIRQDIVGELEAIFVYDAHAMSTDDPRARKVLEDIRDEEREHVGELLALLNILDPDEAQLLANGKEEVKQMMEELNMEVPESNMSTGDTDGDPKSVGSLMD